MKSLAGTNVVYDSETQTGLIVRGWLTASGAPPTTASVFAVGASIINTVTGITYRNVGTSASPSWQANTVETSQAITASDDGTGTGAITAPAAIVSFVAVTSAAATKQVGLPAISASTIGQIIYLTVGSNGYELITPASSNNTINQVDADGTNQLDVAANTTVRCTQISATGWIAETIAATSIAITAPDND